MILPPPALDDLDSFSQILNAGRVGLFSDFDGTLTPLFDNPGDTVLSPGIRETLGEVSERVELVAVVSGRDVRYLREMVGSKSVTYVGNHGLESGRPEGNSRNTGRRSRSASWKKSRVELGVLASLAYWWRTRG